MLRHGNDFFALSVVASVAGGGGSSGGSGSRPGGGARMNKLEMINALGEDLEVLGGRARGGCRVVGLLSVGMFAVCCVGLTCGLLLESAVAAAHSAIGTRASLALSVLCSPSVGLCLQKLCRCCVFLSPASLLLRLSLEHLQFEKFKQIDSAALARMEVDIAALEKTNQACWVAMET